MTTLSDLNRRLVLQAPVETDDGAGGASRDYAAVATVWAQVEPQSMRGGVAADSLGALRQFRIVLRRRDDVTARHRLRDGNCIYRIVAARLSADRRFTEIDAELRED